jgi:uncharacterized membrane protein YvbJ
MTFCLHCGTELKTESNFCNQCGTRIKPEVTITKSQSWGYKFSIVMGVIVTIIGIAFSNPYNILMGISILVVGFVSLKNKSKSVDQFLTIISFILAAIAIINLFKL